MNHSLHTIPLINLAFAFIPAAITLLILYCWSLQSKNAVYAVLRMLVQLLLIGYVLAWIFEVNHAAIILLILLIMVLASSWIALRTVEGRRRALFSHAFVSIVIGGGLTLALVTQLVLTLDPWYAPQAVIPLAGMIFANAMNSVSLAAERLNAEIERGAGYCKARNIAMQSALIPVINALFAVGLVSLPGMMTGQILSGVSPLVASRYQIMVMLMIFGSAGIATALFLVLAKKTFSGNVEKA